MGGQKTFFEHRRAKTMLEITSVLFIIHIDYQNHITYVYIYTLLLLLKIEK